MVMYRTETLGGSGERDAVKVMAYETFDLGNNDILEASSSMVKVAILEGKLFNQVTRCEVVSRELCEVLGVPYSPYKVYSKILDIDSVYSVGDVYRSGKGTFYVVDWIDRFGLAHCKEILFGL